MEEEEDSGPKPCHLCDKEVYIACTHCQQLLCSDHHDDCDCRRQLQIVKENMTGVTRSQYASILLKMVSFFSFETLNQLSLDRKHYDFITSNRLWKYFCHYPELYWRGNEASYAVVKKQHFSPPSLWKYNCDCERLLMENWEKGMVHIKKLSLFGKKIIKLAKVFIDSFGKHWLFLMDGVTLDVWEIRTDPRFHQSIKIISSPEENIRLSNTNIVLSNEILFIIYGNFIQAFAFCHPDYIPIRLYSLLCDKHIKIQNFDYPITVKVAFCVHILEKVIIGHAKDVSSGVIYLHIWDATTGKKIDVVDFSLVDSSEISFGSVESEMCPIEQHVILNVLIHFKTKVKKIFLIVTNVIKAIKEKQECRNAASLALPGTNFNNSALYMYMIELSNNIVFCKKISKDEVIVCWRLQKKLVFNILKMTGEQRAICPPFSVSLRKKLVNPTFKIHLFRGEGERNGLLCVGVEKQRIEVIDLQNTVLQKRKVKKMLCKVNDLNKLNFVDPKFVLILFDKKDIGEMWDAKEGQIITSRTVSNEYVHDLRATWYNLYVVPPSKVVAYSERVLYIIDFEAYFLILRHTLD